MAQINQYDKAGLFKNINIAINIKHVKHGDVWIHGVAATRNCGTQFLRRTDIFLDNSFKTTQKILLGLDYD